MQEIFCVPAGRIVTLTTDEILELHEILCDNYELLPEMEPVSPSGIKNMNMLESAISRQLVGSGEYYKYSDIYSNCATLVFGLVKNHAFHNGNKRIGFLALLKHLYSNGYVISPDIKHIEIYELLRALADSDLQEHAKTYNQVFYKIIRIHTSWKDETQIQYLAWWLRRNAEHKNRKVKQKTISINELERILKKKNLETKFSGKFLTIIRPVSFLQGLVGKNPFKKEYTIKDGKSVALSMVEQMRKDFGLSFLDGVDNSSFFNEEDFLTKEIMSYKKIIYKLAKT